MKVIFQNRHAYEHNNNYYYYCFFFTETVMEYLYSSWPECRKSDYIEDVYILLHLTAKNENEATAWRLLP